MKELMVVAIGGNSIIKDNASQSIEHQAQAVKAVAESVLEMLASDYDIVLTHGNGPQVGLDLRRAEIAHEREGLPLTPLANCVADTQGGIGYLIQQALNNRLAARGEQKAVTVVTQVEVDKNDPALLTLPNLLVRSSPRRSATSCSRHTRTGILSRIQAVATVAWWPHRRSRIVCRGDAIKTLTQKGFVVIGAGGGGIPVIRSEQGDYQSVDAVIDKDLSTALLAREIGADVLAITTGVEKVCINFGKPNQQALDTVSVAQMTRYREEGHFPAGSMLPKIVASLEFLHHGGRRVIITSPDSLPAALRGKPAPILLMKEDKMSENKSRREFISHSGKMVTACALFGATGSVAYAADSAKPTCETGKPMSITAKHYYLDNVLLEAGLTSTAAWRRAPAPS